MKKEIHLKRNLRFLCLTFALDRLLPKVSSKLLDYFIHVNEEFIKFRQERFIEKSNLPSEAIKKSSTYQNLRKQVVIKNKFQINLW